MSDRVMSNWPHSYAKATPPRRCSVAPATCCPRRRPVSFSMAV